MYDFCKICKTKIWQKSKIVCYGYRQFHCIHKTDDIYKDISEDKVDLICSRFDSRFDTSNYELDSQLPKGSNKKVIGLMKDE